MAPTRTGSLRLRGMKQENPMAGKMGITKVSRSALHEIGNKVSNITVGKKRKDLTRNVSVRSKTAAATKTATIDLPAGTNVVVKEEIILKSVETDEPKSTEVHNSMEVQNKHVVAAIDMTKVSNIDAGDEEVPQMVSEYVNDIYAYLRELENLYKVKSNYLHGVEITGKMRAILIDWLCQVHHRFDLLQETLYMTVSILDRFLQFYPVSRNKLQLVGVTCMLLASKYEEMYSPEVSDFVYITDNAYTRTDIKQMELVILKSLDFSLGKPLCLHFLRRNSKAGQVDAKTHTLAKYLMELTIIEYDMVHYKPSLIAASAMCLSIKLLSGGEWTDTLSYYSTYTMNELSDTMKKMAKLVLKAETSKLSAIYAKYQSSKFYKISVIPELKGEQIKGIAEL